MRIEIAQNVIEHLHKMPFGFPRGPYNDEWKVLERPFPITDEEGKVLSQLKPYGEHINDIAKRLGRNKGELIPLLDSLLQKIWVGREGTKEDGYYRVLPWVPGRYELLVKHYSLELLDFLETHLTPESRRESALGTPGMLPWFRVLPRENAIPYNVEVLPTELLSHVIEQLDDNELSITECMDRKVAHMHGEGCDAPVDDTCMLLGFWATTAVECGAARAITKDEARKILKRCRDAGLVHQTGTWCERTIAICSCCPCCCPMLKLHASGIQPGGLQPTQKSNFIADFNIELCSGCMECVKVCPIRAVTVDIKNEKPVFNLEKCIGCGICVEACPQSAVTLKRREEIVTYPRTWDDFLRIRAQQSGRTEFYKEE